MTTNSKRTKGKRTVKEAQLGLDPADGPAFDPPMRLSKSAAVLQARQEPKQTRSSGRAGNASSDAASNPTSKPSAGRTTRATSQVGTQLSAATYAIPNPLVESENFSLADSGEPNPPSTPSDVALEGRGRVEGHSAAPSKPREKVERILAIGERGTELWGYSDEEPMLSEESDGDAYRQIEEPVTEGIEEDEDGADTDVYAEQPTLDEPSIEAMQPMPAPTPRIQTGTGMRKGKKKRTEPMDELDIADFEMVFWIKSGPGRINQPISVSSDTTFPTFKANVANLLNVPASTLELCYLFSFSKTKDYKALTSGVDWERLVCDARNYRSKPATKTYRNVDTWSVQLLEVMEVVENMNKGVTKKKGPMQSARGSMPPPAAPGGVGGVSGGSVPGALGNGDHERNVAEKLKALNGELVCTGHGGTYCLVPNVSTGPIFLKYGLRLEHLRLSDTERRAWAEDMLRDEATKFNPSNKTLEHICARAAGSQNIGTVLTQASGRQRPPPATPSRYEYMAQRTITASYDAPQPLPVSGPGLPQATELKDWLDTLDSSPSRKHQSIKYSALLPLLEAEDVLTLADLIRLGLEGLKAVGIRLGTASRLLDWAKEDAQ